MSYEVIDATQATNARWRRGQLELCAVENPGIGLVILAAIEKRGELAPGAGDELRRAMELRRDKRDEMPAQRIYDLLAVLP